MNCEMNNHLYSFYGHFPRAPLVLYKFDRLFFYKVKEKKGFCLFLSNRKYKGFSRAIYFMKCFFTFYINYINHLRFPFYFHLAFHFWDLLSPSIDKECFLRQFAFTWRPKSSTPFAFSSPWMLYYYELYRIKTGDGLNWRRFNSQLPVTCEVSRLIKGKRPRTIGRLNVDNRGEPEKWKDIFTGKACFV